MASQFSTVSGSYGYSLILKFSGTRT
jgi:hypothetical protein